MNFIIRLIDQLTKGKRNVYSGSNYSGTDTNYSVHYNKNGDFNDNFYINLRKTIAYTEKIVSEIKDVANINYCTILRTVNPTYQGQPFYTFDDHNYLVSSAEIPFDYNAILPIALSVRENLQLPDKDPKELGKILKFEIDVCLYDGAPCAENGFVDESDIPPIDTWFYVTKKYLYCWIPTLFIEPMQQVIDVEALGSYHWLEESNYELNLQMFERLQSSYKQNNKFNPQRQ